MSQRKSRRETLGEDGAKEPVLSQVREDSWRGSLNLKAPRAWMLVAGWLVVASVFVWNIHRWVQSAVPLGRPWQEPGLYLLDFRDLIMVPGRFLLGGGNPYDPRAYLAANPWAQEFDPYAPSWLWLSAALAWMPLEVAASIYLGLMSILLIGLSVVISRLVFARHWAATAPIVSLWLLLWYPTRYLGSSFIACLGVALIFLALGHREYPRTDAIGRLLLSPWFAALGLSVALVKPQFGGPLMLFLAALGAWNWIWRGILILAITSLPPLVICVRNAGGVMAFLDGIKAVIAHASSPAAPTGLGSPHMFRTDLQGLWYRVFDWDPGWLGYAICASLLLSSLALARHAPVELLPCLIGPVILVLPIHLDYDYVLMLWAAVGAVLFWKKKPIALSVVLVACASAPLLQIYALQRILTIEPLIVDLFAFFFATLTWTITSCIVLTQKNAGGGKLRTLPNRNSTSPDSGPRTGFAEIDGEIGNKP